jgi:hypothetical protein
VQNRRNRDGSFTNRTASAAPTNGQSADGKPGHPCPWCGSSDTELVKRGFIGPTDDRNQFLTCNDCNQLTWEIVSRTARDLRVGQFQVGDIWRDMSRQTRYTITRILKVGMNEILLYVKPIIRAENKPANDPGSH